MSQARVSQALSGLVADGLVQRTADAGRPRWAPADWDALVDWWLMNYPGPGGITTYWYGLAGVPEQARAAVAALITAGVPVVVSGDVAADMIAPWRRPGRAIVYADPSGRPVHDELTAAGLTPSDAGEATLELIVPADPGVWPAPGTTAAEADLPLADPLQLLWDVARAPGVDVDQAVAALRPVLKARAAVSAAHRLVLVSAGRASDAAFLAAADLAVIAAELDVPYRLVGGNAVTLLVAVHGVSGLVPARETADADFGAAYPVVADPRLLAAPRERGYRQQSGNRFLRTHTLPPPTGRAAPSWDLVIDVLAPSYVGRLQPNQPHGELVVDEVPGRGLALARDASPVTVEVTLTSGHSLITDLMLPDVVSAICLKAYAYVGRLTERDAVDLWRLLEAAYVAGVTADIWPSGPTATEAAAALRQHFGRPGAPGLARAADSMRDRIRIAALVAHVVGPP